MRGGQGRTRDELAEAAAIRAWCGGGFVALFLLALILRGVGVEL